MKKILTHVEQKQASGPLAHINDFPELMQDVFFDELRKKEFNRLDEQEHTYLDYTGGGLYGTSQIQEHLTNLSGSILGNPHSSNPSSQLSTIKVSEARKKVLEYFNATEDYVCVFTANASAALKIVGECYPFCDQSQLLLFYDNHNSVNGIREYCNSKEGAYKYCNLFIDDLRVDENEFRADLKNYPNKKNKLVAFPAQSNVSGVRHPLNYIKEAQAEGWDVLLDAAAYVPTSPLNLKEHQPEFVSMSFYKMFGYPTGLGCLMIKKSVFGKLRKAWFAGGTVSFVSVNTPGHYLQMDHERFENGTVNYLDIPAITIGLKMMEKIGIQRIKSKVMALTDLLLREMKEISYSNGQNLVNIIGPQNMINRGGTIIFNLYNRDGNITQFLDVENDANEQNISLRTGCFCNPGIDEIMSCVSPNESMRYYSIKEEDFSYEEAINYLGRMRGAIRISVGFITNVKDISKFIGFLRQYVKEK